MEHQGRMLDLIGLDLDGGLHVGLSHLCKLYLQVALHLIPLFTFVFLLQYFVAFVIIGKMSCRRKVDPDTHAHTC